ncbi:MAG: serine/threonine protein kinase [Planctomyces sp.]|nr:serine/threonine protein kinase [Planctomyces sp.]
MSVSDESLAAVLDDVARRLRAGESPRLNDVVASHPEHASDLQELWGTLLLAEDLASNPVELDSDSFVLPAGSGAADLPRVVGDYELIEELGRGGMGIVYLARQISLNRAVAVKMILRGELASPADVARFRAEAESAARLEHPNIVAIYDVGEDEGRPYFSMQHVPGTTLGRKLLDGPLPPREAAALLVPVCRAIAHAHRRGILHRDLKPSNVLIDPHGCPFVTDFGLAKRLRGDEPASAAGQHPTITRSGDILGTPGYIAPEQAAGDRGEITPATDVYSLGAILYAAITGRAPFQSASPVDTLLMVLEQDPPPPRLLNPQADVDLELIALKALQKPADLRYASADALADDLEAYLNHESISARSSHFSQILSRAFRPTHHAAILRHWGRLWMLHALVLLILCLVTNVVQLRGVTSRWPYALLWTVGLGTWAAVFWNLRRRSGPVTFVERQIAHVWAASMACSTMLFAVEAALGLPVLALSPVLPLIAGGVFVVKAGILSGEFYIPAAALFATSLPMALWPQYGLTLFGIVSALTFFVPGLKFHREQNRRTRASSGG